MREDNESKEQTQHCDDRRNVRVRLSPALMEMARRALKDFEAESDEAFLIRAEMDKKLSL